MLFYNAIITSDIKIRPIIINYNDCLHIYYNALLKLKSVKIVINLNIFYKCTLN